MRRIIKRHLDKIPCASTSLSLFRYLICDGTFTRGRRGVFGVMDAESRRLIAGVTDCPESAKALIPLFTSLKERGLSPLVATIDGNPSIFKALRSVWPEIIIQRCLVHIQRQGLSWCREKPKRTDAMQLRKIFLKIFCVRDHKGRKAFLKSHKKWERAFGNQIASKPSKGWVFSDLQRARSMLNAALPLMFHYLDDPKIPKTTNALEGYYSRLKDKYRQHRGLSKKHQDSFFRWYIYLQVS